MPRAIRSTAAVQSVRNAAHNLLPNVAPQVVQSDAMESTANHAFPESLLAAMPQLSEKPRMGVRSKNPAWHPGLNVCNSTVVLGLQFRCSETVSGPVVAPNNGTQPKQPTSPVVKLICQQQAKDFQTQYVAKARLSVWASLFGGGAGAKTGYQSFISGWASAYAMFVGQRDTAYEIGYEACLAGGFSQLAAQ